MPGIVTDFQRLEKPKKPIASKAFRDAAPRFYPPKIQKSQTVTTKETKTSWEYSFQGTGYSDRLSLADANAAKGTVYDGTYEGSLTLESATGEKLVRNSLYVVCAD